MLRPDCIPIPYLLLPFYHSFKYFLLWTFCLDCLILNKDEQFALNPTENARKVFSKNITCKTSRTGVDWENTNVFNFYVTKKLFKTYV